MPVLQSCVSHPLIPTSQKMNPADIRILYQDVDGCLNPEDGEPFGVELDWKPSGRQIAMLNKISEAIDASPLEHWVINTGRHWEMFHYLADHLKTSKLRYFLLEHACVLYDRQQETYIDIESILTSADLASLSKRYDKLHTIEALLDWYDTVGKRKLEGLFDVELPRLNKRANLSFAVPDGIDGDDLLRATEAEIRSDFSDTDCACIEFFRSDRFIDIIPGIHKLDGIELMSAYLSMEKEQSLAMGDFLNDLPVFEAFPNVLCPANAHPRIIELTRSKGAGGIASEHAYGKALLEFLKA